MKKKHWILALIFSFQASCWASVSSQHTWPSHGDVFEQMTTDRDMGYMDAVYEGATYKFSSLSSMPTEKEKFPDFTLASFLSDFAIPFESTWFDAVGRYRHYEIPEISPYLLTILDIDIGRHSKSRSSTGESSFRSFRDDVLYRDFSNALLSMNESSTSDFMFAKEDVDFVPGTRIKYIRYSFCVKGVELRLSAMRLSLEDDGHFHQSAATILNSYKKAFGTRVSSLKKSFKRENPEWNPENILLLAQSYVIPDPKNNIYEEKEEKKEDEEGEALESRDDREAPPGNGITDEEDDL
ncbi:MAG: hypothetical protein GY915_06855 [bacterium]|nr:hypothetical protein [bacterium]